MKLILKMVQNGNSNSNHALYTTKGYAYNIGFGAMAVGLNAASTAATLFGISSSVTNNAKQ
jgi:hypothetical protein